MITYIWPSSDTLTFEENFRFHVDRLRPIAEILAEKGCRFGLEFLGPWTVRKDARYEFIHNMDGMLALCAAVGTDNMGLLLDCWHWYTAGGRVEQINKLRDEDIVCVHINDAPAGIAMDEQIDTVRCLPGETGVIDIRGFLSALAEIGYSGPVVVEPFNERLKNLPPKQALQETAAALKEVWSW
ncbi:MAG: TIM barrel protein [Armatimonadetes bacterium]|nr:TIM barrel protein [Armatimonadota bacterium]NIO75135.1 TIM barrel protein [Armatimonadota bacterium]NIO95759.1 TIM barrel protein [Armatimonadota bacterium]